ncbi:ABC transporter C member 13 [Coemansia aciculifera]|uniref:ABC transporter C member 13 n=1 Tax=Coemansia aciculifera TaxID=417176 RepID=A0A9W8M791_9FUNG|nr:ABC transporter C member 13 [Coemansia aciculifera]
MNATLRANILFGREYDEDYYWKVLSACALTDDLEMWPKSDMTVIGENGMNISGGQRARLALARTVYSRADIYFLDDPLSAVDAIVKRHILDNIILSTGLLGNKLRFVTTNADNILPLCNQIATVDNGRVSVKVQTPQVHTAFEFKATTPKMAKAADTERDAEAPYIIDSCRPPVQWPPNGKIEFRDFSMKYGADLGYALKNVNLTINPGEKIGIVGRTGAGKSSLAKVLFRLVHENTSGSIMIDGQDISEFGVGDYRPQLGMIPQESTMLDGSIRHNLDPLNQFDIEGMWASLIKCNMAKVVSPYRSSDTEQNDESDDDSEEGRASSGQQQLFSLCRVIMRKRRIIVLDEATANVDLETDKSIQELIRKEFSDCTVLTIAHRLDTIMSSDRIIVMDKGTVAEIGTPQELLAKDGMFAQLVKTSEFGQ